MWDNYFDMNTVSEIRLKTTVSMGPGAIAKIDFIAEELKKRGVNQVLCMTGGHSYKLTGAWDHVEAACKKHGIGITLYNKVTPNPTTVAIDEAVALAKKDNAKAVIGTKSRTFSLEPFAVHPSLNGVLFKVMLNICILLRNHIHVTLHDDTL